MSIDPEDSLLEQALRGDLPSPDTEARLRRRLLAAGLALGNGVATTTAAAGAAASGTATTGLIAKVVGVSWGVKLGFAAVVAIPTLGLWLDGQTEHHPQVQPALVVPARRTEARPEQAPTLPKPAAHAVELAAPEPERSGRKTLGPAATAEAPLPPDSDVARPSHPSQADFGAPEPSARAPAPQVPSTLAEETRLLDGAFAAIAAGDRSRAAQLIQDHQARYPRGLLQKERERAELRLSEMSRGQ
jgi:hypothetical protein